MFLCFLIAATRFFGLNFFQLCQLGSTTGRCRIKRFSWFRRWLFFHNRCNHLFSDRRRGSFRFCFGLNSLDNRFISRFQSSGGTFVLSWLFQPFLKSAHSRSAFLCGQAIIGLYTLGLDRCSRCGNWRRGRGFDFWCGRTVRCRRRAFAAHLDLYRPAPCTSRIRPKLAGIDAAECQPVS